MRLLSQTKHSKFYVGMEKEGFFTLYSYAATGISRRPLQQDSYLQPEIHPNFSEILVVEDLMDH